MARGEAATDCLWGITVQDGDEVIASAIYTTRKALFVSPHPDEATRTLVSALPPDTPIPDVVGQAKAAWAVAQMLGRFELFIEGSLYALEAAPLASAAPIRCIRADLSHLSMIVDWNIAFISELRMKDPIAEVSEHAKFRIENGQYFLAYRDDEPVAMAGGTYVGEGIGSIGPVYTLPSYRGRGLKLGQAVTAHTAMALRSAGAQCVVLMADQRNPVSNAAYQKIGFINRGQFHHLQNMAQPSRLVR